MEALLIVAHGSRRPDAGGVMERVCQDVAHRVSFPVALGYLQFQRPSVEEAIAELFHRGIRSLVVVPAFLSWGTHVTEDLPRLLQMMKKQYPGMRLFLAEPLGYDERLADILLVRASRNLQEV